MNTFIGRATAAQRLPHDDAAMEKAAAIAAVLASCTATLASVAILLALLYY